MSRLIVFGDSFTYLHECDKNNENYYSKYKINENDLHWSEIVSIKLNLKLFNFGYGSFSNYRIIDSIIENFDLIEKNDIIIISKTFYNRIDIPNDSDLKFTTITPSADKLLKKLGFSENEMFGILFYNTLVDNKNFIERVDKIYDFIKKMIKNKEVKKCIFWNVSDYMLKYETITDATENKIIDNHWSYKGNRDFSNEILKLIENG
jgi:hypothetical protein